MAMPIDKQSKGSTNKPITPALSSRFRTTKTPVAPRLAGTSPASPIVAARRDLREHTLSPAIEQNPASPIDVNVTPRSGARNTRISTESPASPATSRGLSGNGSIQGVLASRQQAATISSPSNRGLGQSRLISKASTPNISTVRRVSGSSNISKKDEEPNKFFRANDAKSIPSFQSPKSALSPRPLCSPLLKDESARAVNSAPPSAVHSRNVHKDENFARANEAQLRATRPLTMARKQSATSLASMNTARTRSPELSRTQSYPQPRAQPTNQASPGKSKATPIINPVSPEKQNTAQSPSAILSLVSPSDRRESFGSSTSSPYPVRPSLHQKSASVGSFGPPKILACLPSKEGRHLESTWMSPTVTIPMPQHNLMIASPETLSPRSASLASSKTMGTSVTSDTDASEVSKGGISYPSVAQPDLPTQTNQTIQTQLTPLAQAQMNAANARRERKVLDLEISNSSLLAINKTLEKELRKQSAELRRFRRLSRSGRLSFAPSYRSVSAQSAISLDTLPEQTEDEEEYSDEDDEESDLDGLDEEVDDSIEDPPDMSTTRARRRARDEQRLMLDLAKHQQLLVDSQKLTQSIRKCLNMSEDLIKEGNQALKYKVGIGDVKLGGRVLSAEDFDLEHELDVGHDDQGLPRKALLSPSITKTDLQEASLWLTDGPEEVDTSYVYSPDYRDPD